MPTARRSCFTAGFAGVASTAVRTESNRSRESIAVRTKTAVEAIFAGKARQYNRRFPQMCSHHLIEPVACTPAAGWEKGQAENQAGNPRDQLFRPKLRVKSLAELNCYSVDARAAGRMVLVRSHAERIAGLFNDEIAADHPRHFRRDQTIYDPWHYLPVLLKKPGALRNGAPFKNRDLPPSLAQVRGLLAQHADGDRQFVKVLGAGLDHGLAAVEAACAEALEAGLAAADVILTILARQRQPVSPPSITTPDALRLNIEPVADCGRYDSIRRAA